MTKKPVGITGMFIALLPIFLHVILFFIGIFKNKNFTFQTPDLIIFVLIWLCLFSLIFTKNHKEYFFRLVLIAYSFLFVIVSMELFLRLTEPYMPWYPMHRITYTAEGVMPGTSGKIEFSVNKYGLRGPNMNLNKTEIKILVIV